MTTSEQRFTVLYERYHEAVGKYVARRVVDADVGDVVANVFLTAWRRLPDVPRAEPLPWLYGTARRVIANNARGRHRGQKLVDRLRNQSFEAGHDHSDAVARRLDVAVAFDRLSEVDQEVLRLVAWGGVGADTGGESAGMQPDDVRDEAHPSTQTPTARPR